MIFRKTLALSILMLLVMTPCLPAASEYAGPRQAIKILKEHSTIVDLERSLYFSFPFGSQKEEIEGKLGPASSEVRNRNGTILFFGGDVALGFHNLKLNEVILGRSIINIPVHSQFLNDLSYSHSGNPYWFIKSGITVNSSLAKIRITFPALMKQCCGENWVLAGNDYTAYFVFYPKNETHDKQFLKGVYIKNEVYGSTNCCKAEETVSYETGTRLWVTALDSRDKFIDGRKISQIYLDCMSVSKTFPPVAIYPDPPDPVLNVFSDQNVTKNIIGRYYKLNKSILYNKEMNDQVYNFGDIFTEWIPPQNAIPPTIIQNCPESISLSHRLTDGVARLYNNDFSWMREFDLAAESRIHLQRYNRVVNEYQVIDYNPPIHPDEYEVISACLTACNYAKNDIYLIYHKTPGCDGFHRICQSQVYAFTGNAITIEDYIKKNLKVSQFENRFDKSLNIVLFSEEYPENGKYTHYLDYLEQKYPNARTLYTFSRVGFNENHTEAVLYIQRRGFMPSGGGSLVYLRKQNQRWRQILKIKVWIS